MTERGLFIVFEGIDRAGKTTQATRLENELAVRGTPIYSAHFPFRTSETGKEIDRFLKNKGIIRLERLHVLFSQNRWEQSPAIIDALESGKWVVCDRYAYSGVAYSIAKGMELERALKDDVGLPEPDIVIYLDIVPDSAAARPSFGDEAHDKIAFQETVAEAYLKLKSENWCIVDATQAERDVQAVVVDAVLAAAERPRQPLKKLWSSLK